MLYLDTQQFYRAGGRLECAADAATGGAVAMSMGHYAQAVSFFLMSVEAYPHPTTLRRLGLCLLLDRRPADSVLYFAAAVELSDKSRRTRPSLLLAKALLTAGNEPRCARLLKNGTETFPKGITDQVVEAFRDGWKKADLHSLIDNLLGLIPESHDTIDAKDDPPVDFWRLYRIYNARKDNSTSNYWDV